MAFSRRAEYLVTILVLSVSASSLVFAQSDHINSNKTVLDVSYVIQHLDSLDGEKITVNGTYDYRYPFPFAMECGWASIPKLSKSASYDSEYVASPWGTNYLYKRTSLFDGPVLELRSANTSNPYIPSLVPLNHGEPAIITGKLVKQYIRDNCGSPSPTYFKSTYLLVDPPRTGKFKLENMTHD